MAKKDFQVTCADHPDWIVRDLTARQAKETADEHDEQEHNGQSLAQTEKQPTEDRSKKSETRRAGEVP